MSFAANCELVISEIKKLINFEKICIICGDFNICYFSQKNNIISSTLENFGFEHLVTVSTHLLGHCIDHVYVRKPKNNTADIIVETISPYFSDHDVICIVIKLNVVIRENGKKRKIGKCSNDTAPNSTQKDTRRKRFRKV